MLARRGTATATVPTVLAATVSPRAVRRDGSRGFGESLMTFGVDSEEVTRTLKWALENP